MNIAVLGTGNVGATISTKLLSLQHTVVMGARNANNEKAQAFAQKQAKNFRTATFNDAAKDAELIINCTSGKVWKEVFVSIATEHLANKVLLDLSNPLDFSQGMPPQLSVCNNTSVAEEIQSLHPQALVVKSLNTMWCGLMVDPMLLDNANHTVFMSGNSEVAKAKVKVLLQSFGWKNDYILDLGDLSTARGTEMYLPLWLRLYGVKKSSAFNIKIVGH